MLPQCNFDALLTISMTYVSTPRCPALGFQSSGHKARPLARHLGRGTDRNMDEPEPRLPLSSCRCPEPAFSPGDPQLKITQAEMNLGLLYILHLTGLSRRVLTSFRTNNIHRIQQIKCSFCFYPVGWRRWIRRQSSSWAFAAMRECTFWPGNRSVNSK